MKINREWFVDINQYEGMLYGAQEIVREDNNNNDGENDGLMIVGVNQINNNARGGLSPEDAQLISACPDMFNALIDILINGYNIQTISKAQKAIKKATKHFF
jgi:hypothetical protein